MPANLHLNERLRFAPQGLFHGLCRGLNVCRAFRNHSVADSDPCGAQAVALRQALLEEEVRGISHGPQNGGSVPIYGDPVRERSVPAHLLFPPFKGGTAGARAVRQCNSSLHEMEVNLAIESESRGFEKKNSKRDILSHANRWGARK